MPEAYTKESQFGNGHYIYEQEQDGLYYLTSHKTTATRIGYTQQQMTEAGYIPLHEVTR